MNPLDHNWNLSVEWNESRHAYRWSVLNTLYPDLDASGYEDTVDAAFDRLVEYKHRMVDYPVEYLQTQIVNYLTTQSLTIEWKYDGGVWYGIVLDDSNDIVSFYKQRNRLKLVLEVVSSINRGVFQTEELNE